MEAKFKLMENARETYKAKYKPAKPLIRRVPNVLKDHRQTFSKYFEPRVVSIGPFHHGNPKFKFMEEVKFMLAQQFVEASGQEKEVLYEEIEKNINDLRNSYDEEPEEKNKNNQDLAWILFVDGCAILQFLSHLSKKSEVIEVGLTYFAEEDLLLLENQLPYQVLDLLISKCGEIRAQELEKSIIGFILANILPAQYDNSDFLMLDPKPLHLLDLLRRELLSRGHPPPQQRSEWVVSIFPCTRNRQLEVRDRHTTQAQVEMSNVVSSPLPTQDINRTVSRPSETRSLNTRNSQSCVPRLRRERPPTFRNIKELKAAWIDVRPAKSRSLRNIDFKGCCKGKLMLPPIQVSGSTAPIFLNLTALEMCPDYNNDFGICSYICFMDSLIDHPEDVKELRKQDILHNFLGSDEEVAKLFNEISIFENPKLYYDVKKKIQAHFDMPICTWIAQVVTDHFSSPWSILALLGVLTGLILTLLQVLYAK